MQKRGLILPLLLTASLGMWGCSEDAPMGEPAGMGAEQPDTTGGSESGVVGEVEPDAEKVLEGAGTGPLADTTQQTGSKAPMNPEP